VSDEPKAICLKKCFCIMLFGRVEKGWRSLCNGSLSDGVASCPCVHCNWLEMKLKRSESGEA